MTFVLALAVTLFVTVRLAVHAAYWSHHRDAALAEWMTIGYVAHSYQVDPRDLAKAAGLQPGEHPGQTLAEIAAPTGRPVEDLEAALREGIAASRRDAEANP
jgi:hypothetical protein